MSFLPEYTRHWPVRLGLTISGLWLLGALLFILFSEYEFGEWPVFLLITLLTFLVPFGVTKAVLFIITTLKSKKTK